MKFKGTPKKIKEKRLKIKKKKEEDYRHLVKTEKKAIAKYSPKIKRTIPEWAVSSAIISCAGFLVIILLIFLQVQQIKALKEQRSVLEANLRVWQAVLQKYPDYRDGYMQSAVLEYRLNNTNDARQYTEKALSIDSTYEPAKRFMEILKN